MRVAQINLIPDYGGAERHTLLLSQGLQALGHEVRLVCHPGGRLRAEAEAAAMPALAVFARNQLDAGAVPRLAAALRSFRPHVIHVHTPRDYVSGFMAAKILDASVAITRHLLLPLKPGMRPFYRSSDLVVCLCKAARENLARFGVKADRLALIYGAIDTAPFRQAPTDISRSEVRYELGVRNSDFAVGIIGRLVTGKGHGVLMEAMATLLKVHPRAKMLIIGDGPERPVLEAHARELGLGERVIFIGFRLDIHRVLPALDAIVVSSTEAELLPLALMEALAAGRPVVASRIGGVPEIVEHDVNGLLTPPGDAAALSSALLQIAENPVRAAQLGKAGAALVHTHFALPRMAEETARAYRRTCGPFR